MYKKEERRNTRGTHIKSFKGSTWKVFEFQGATTPLMLAYRKNKITVEENRAINLVSTE